jgi:hypothetical protein
MKLVKDWLDLFMDNDFQQDLVFLLIVFIGKITGIFDENTFTTLAVVIIGGDAVKKLGAKK